MIEKRIENYDKGRKMSTTSIEIEKGNSRSPQSIVFITLTIITKWLLNQGGKMPQRF